MNSRAPFGIGGAGGAYLLAPEGELVVEVYKRDLNVRDVHTELRALLVSPDRFVVDEAFIPDDGLNSGDGIGPEQSIRLTTKVTRPGIYALNVTVSGDRYGEMISWGFRTNCERYIIETARGHKDAAHVEPIVFLNAGIAGCVCFQPTENEFAVEVSDLNATGRVSITDAEGAQIAEAGIEDSLAHIVFSPGQRENTPWMLNVPEQQCSIHIDSVTRWPNAKGGIFDKAQTLTLWTPHPESWFPLHDVRWLVTPYQQTRYCLPGDDGEVTFRIENGASRTMSYDLTVETPEDGKVVAELSIGAVELASGESRDVRMHYSASDLFDTESIYLRVTPRDAPELSTFAALILKRGEAPANRPFDLPLVLRPYAHENEQFGHVPDFPTEGQLYFDAENRPAALVSSHVHSLQTDGWNEYDTGSGFASSKIAFDAENRWYILVGKKDEVSLGWSEDAGRTFSESTITDVTRRTSYDIEQFSGQNVSEHPPPVLIYRQTENDENLIWRKLNDVELVLPEYQEGRIVIGKPIPVTTGCIGLSSHSGIVSSVVSRGSKVHMVWAEATDPSEVLPGVPTFVATYDRESRQLGEKVFIGYGPPPNDCHNSPSITIDSEGYLHVMVGTHGAPFPYSRSLMPNDAYSGWTEALPVGEDLRQTYVGFVCDKEDTLHLVFRLWQKGTKYHPHSHCAVLTHMTKRKGEPWSEPAPLIYPPFSEYSVYYHRLTIDREGRLFLSYDYWSTHWFYRNDHPGRRRTSIMSSDCGKSWQLVRTALLK